MRLSLDHFLWMAEERRISRIAEIIYREVLPVIDDEVSEREILAYLEEKGVKASIREVREAIEIVVSDSDMNPGILEYRKRNGEYVIVKKIKFKPRLLRELAELLSP